jgi:hypothetical protein
VHVLRTCARECGHECLACHAARAAGHAVVTRRKQDGHAARAERRKRIAQLLRERASKVSLVAAVRRGEDCGLCILLEDEVHRVEIAADAILACRADGEEVDGHTGRDANGVLAVGGEMVPHGGGGNACGPGYPGWLRYRLTTHLECWRLRRFPGRPMLFPNSCLCDMSRGRSGHASSALNSVPATTALPACHHFALSSCRTRSQ